MTIEEKLKALILSRYHSIREFTITIDMPYTTIDSIFRRGIGNSSVTNVIKICKALGISVDALADGRIVPVKNILTASKERYFEIEDIFEDTKALLEQQGFITLDGKPVSQKNLDSLIDAIEVGVEIVKKRTEEV